MSDRWAIISSHYVNAWGLVDLIRSSGWAGRIVCLRHPADGNVLVDLYGTPVEVWEVPDQTPLIQALASRIPQADQKWLFFTEEQTLQEVAQSSSHPWLANATWLPGPECNLGNILDRARFYEIIEQGRLGCVPRTISAATDPFAAFGDEFFFRFRETWVKGRKTPRIRLIRGREDLARAIAQHTSSGYQPTDWCYQERLSLEPQDNISVCGWHDDAAPRYVATHKVLQFPERQGNGDVCELLPLSEDLHRTTRNLLATLAYRGPFELEFVRDTRDGQLRIIELNPRFWMQHPLAGGNLGQALVRRYLGMSGDADGPGPTPLYWVNTIVALNRLLRCDFRGWRYLRHERALRVPPLAVTLRWLPLFLPNLMRRWRR